MTNKKDDHLQEVESDHELILLLKTKIEDLSDQLETSEENLETSEGNLEVSEENHNDTAEQLAIHEKLSAQHTLLRHVFYGVVGLIVCMWALVFVGWLTGQSAIEREMAFFERIILVLIGIVGGAVSSFFDVRNFTISNPTKNNGNSNSKNGKVKDFE